MDSLVLIVIATFAFTIIKADDDEVIKVYEIRKLDDDANRLDEADDRIDAQYYDPDSADMAEYKASKNQMSRNKNVDIITNSILDRLKRIVNSKHDENRDDDYIASYSNLKDSASDDDDRPSLVIVADKNLLYHLIPKKSKRLQDNLLSVLRSIDGNNEVEERTAPPRVRPYFDYDYD